MADKRLDEDNAEDTTAAKEATPAEPPAAAPASDAADTSAISDTATDSGTSSTAASASPAPPDSSPDTTATGAPAPGAANAAKPSGTANTAQSGDAPATAPSGAPNTVKPSGTSSTEAPANPANTTKPSTNPDHTASDVSNTTKPPDSSSTHAPANPASTTTRTTNPDDAATDASDAAKPSDSSATAVPSATPEPADASDTTPSSTEAPEPKPVLARRRGSKLLVAGRVLVGLVSAAVLAAMSLVYLRVDELDQSKNTTDAVAEAQEPGPNAPTAPADDDGANDILVAGNDSRTDMQGRPLSAKILRLLRTEATETTNTDTLILLRIPHDGGKPSAVSIPRDTSVFVAERNREEKINGVYGITKDEVVRRMSGEPDRAKVQRDSDDAGRTSLIQAVQGLTGVRVDHYVEVSLYGFYLLTEAIDGVDVCLNHATSDPDSGASFRRGPQTVKAGDAVAFVRQRKNLPRGDLDRIVRQQVFLSSAMQKVLSGDLLTNTAKLNALEEAVSRTVIMDAGLHFLDLVGLAQTMASGNVQFVTIPVEAVGARNDRQQSIIIVDVPKVQAFVKGLLTPQPVGLDAPGDYGTAPAAAVAQPAIPCVD